MKRFFFIFTIFLLAVVALCLFAVPQTAKADRWEGLVRWNAISVQNPLKWDRSFSNISSYTDISLNDRESLYLGRGGSSLAGLQNNVLSSSVVGTGGQYAYLDFKFSRQELLDLISSYTTYYNLPWANNLTFTVNLENLSSYYIIQCWGRSSINGSPSGTVSSGSRTSSGLFSLTISLDTHVYNYYSFLIQTYGSVRIDGFKLEIGVNSFTGFVYDDYQVNGYNLGFTQGFDEGKQVYSTRSFSLDYSDVEPGAVPSAGNIRYTKGYTQLFGFTSADQLADIALSFTPAWFTYKEYSVVSSGYILLSDSNNQINGILVYASPESNVTPSSTDFQVLSYLMIFDTYSQFSTIDPSLPQTQNPVQFPMIYACSGYAQLGFNEFMEELEDQYYQKGFTDGQIGAYANGYNVGLAKGYSDGITTASNGSWQSLMSALVDIPVKTVTSLLDFDFLGFNMLNLLKLLITLTLFFFVLNFLIGKVKSV